MPQLIYNPGLFDEKVFEIEEPATAIGRSNDCGICLLHKSLSRRHAQVEIDDGKVFLVDLQSKNGSFVNGSKVERQEIHSGDTVKLGDLQFSYVNDASVASLPGMATAAGGGRGPEPTLVMGMTRLSMEQLLRDVSAGGALRVKQADADKRSQDKLQILLKVSQLLSSPGEIDALLRKILELVFQILDVDRAAILFVDPATGALVPKVVKSNVGDGHDKPFYSQHIVEYVRSKALAALFTDASIDPRLAAAHSVIYQSIRASMCVPLTPKDDVIGVLYVDNVTVPSRFSEEDLEFLAAFANQAAIAIENATLYQRIEAEAITRMQLVMQEKLSSLSALVAGIAHELKNPLNFINNFAELSVELTDDVQATVLTQEARLEPDAASDLVDALRDLRENAGKVREHGRRASGIIDGMLLHARGSQGAREEAELNAVVAEAVNLAYRGVQARDASFHAAIEADYDAALGEVEMVVDDLRRVFINVVDNACYALREKSRSGRDGYAPVLSVSTRGDAERVEIRIKDNGTGIPIEVAEKIYNPFFSTKPPGEGTGLGLSISYDIVVQGHQGEMRMDTVSGESTEFVISLPRKGGPASRGRQSLPRMPFSGRVL